MDQRYKSLGELGNPRIYSNEEERYKVIKPGWYNWAFDVPKYDLEKKRGEFAHAIHLLTEFLEQEDELIKRNKLGSHDALIRINNRLESVVDIMEQEGMDELDEVLSLEIDAAVHDYQECYLYCEANIAQCTPTLKRIRDILRTCKTIHNDINIAFRQIDVTRVIDNLNIGLSINEIIQKAIAAANKFDIKTNVHSTLRTAEAQLKAANKNLLERAKPAGENVVHEMLQSIMAKRTRKTLDAVPPLQGENRVRPMVLIEKAIKERILA